MRTLAALAAALFCLAGCDTAGDTATELRAIERARAGLLADLHSEREECRALAISLSAEPQDFRNKQFSVCMEGVRASVDALAKTLKDMDRRIGELRASIKPAP